MHAVAVAIAVMWMLSTSAIAQRVSVVADGLSSILGVAVVNTNQVVVTASCGLFLVSLSGSSTAIAGGPSSCGYAEGTGSAAQFSQPWGVALDGSGGYFVGDFSNNRVRRVSSSGSTSTYAGSGVAGFKDGPLLTAQFYGVTGVIRDSSGNLYVGDYSNQRLRKVSASGVVSTIAGNGTTGSTDGVGTSATFNVVNHLALSYNEDRIYVGDRTNNLVRVVVLSTTMVTTLAGQTSGGYHDGIGTNALFQQAAGVALGIDRQVLYLTDQANCRLRRINLLTTAVTTVAGSAACGTATGTGTSAEFNYPQGLATWRGSDNAERIAIADLSNNRLVLVVMPVVVETVTRTLIAVRSSATRSATEARSRASWTVSTTRDVTVTKSHTNVRTPTPTAVVSRTDKTASSSASQPTSHTKSRTLRATATRTHVSTPSHTRTASDARSETATKVPTPSPTRTPSPTAPMPSRSVSQTAFLSVTSTLPPTVSPTRTKHSTTIVGSKSCTATWNASQTLPSPTGSSSLSVSQARRSRSASLTAGYSASSSETRSDASATSGVSRTTTASQSASPLLRSASATTSEVVSGSVSVSTTLSAAPSQTSSLSLQRSASESLSATSSRGTASPSPSQSPTWSLSPSRSASQSGSESASQSLTGTPTPTRPSQTVSPGSATPNSTVTESASTSGNETISRSASAAPSTSVTDSWTTTPSSSKTHCDQLLCTVGRRFDGLRDKNLSAPSSTAAMVALEQPPTFIGDYVWVNSSSVAMAELREPQLPALALNVSCVVPPLAQGSWGMETTGKKIASLPFNATAENLAVAGELLPINVSTTWSEGNVEFLVIIHPHNDTTWWVDSSTDKYQSADVYLQIGFYCGSIRMSQFVHIPVDPAPLPINQGVRGTAAAAAAATAVSAALGGASSAADGGSLAALSMMTCWASPAKQNASPMRYLLSPFVDLGAAAMVLGNVGIATAVLTLQLAVLAVLQRQVRNPSRLLQLTSRALFPNVALTVASLFSQGAVRGVVGVVFGGRWGAAEVLAVLVGPGWLLGVGFLWAKSVQWIAANGYYAANTAFDNWSATARKWFAPRGFWQPLESRRRFGGIMNAMHEHRGVRLSGVPLLHGSLFAAISAIEVGPSGCGAQFLVLALITAPVPLVLVYRAPYRALATNFASALCFSSLLCMSVVLSIHAWTPVPGIDSITAALSAIQSVLMLLKGGYAVIIAVRERGLKRISSERSVDLGDSTDAVGVAASLWDLVKSMFRPTPKPTGCEKETDDSDSVDLGGGPFVVELDTSNNVDLFGAAGGESLSDGVGALPLSQPMAQERHDNDDAEEPDAPMPVAPDKERVARRQRALSTTSTDLENLERAYWDNEGRAVVRGVQRAQDARDNDARGTPDPGGALWL